MSTGACHWHVRLLLSSNVKLIELHGARGKLVFVVVVVVVVVVVIVVVGSIIVGRFARTHLYSSDDEYNAKAQDCATTTGKRTLSQSTLQHV
jgi:hypothetical protein